MLSLFKSKNTHIEEIKNLFPGVLPVSDDKVLLGKIKVSNEIQIFEELKDRITQHVMILTDLETLLASPIKKVESYLATALLPDHKDAFVELMAYVKITGCYHAKDGQQAYQDALEILMYVLHDDSGMDCFDLIYLMKKMSRWPPSIGSDRLISVSMQSTRIDDCINSIKDGDDMAIHMMKVKDNHHVTEKLKAFFEVVRRVNVTPI